MISTSYMVFLLPSLNPGTMSLDMKLLKFHAFSSIVLKMELNHVEENPFTSQVLTFLKKSGILKLSVMYVDSVSLIIGFLLNYYMTF